MKKPTENYIKNVLLYNPETGEFLWKYRNDALDMWNKTWAGKAAGTSGDKYLKIGLLGKIHAAHRLAWLYMTGEWPKGEIDHINGNKFDNRWDNIRESTKSQNQCNRTMTRKNTSGYKGVCMVRGRWMAQIKVRNKHFYLGYFAKPEDAYVAYCSAAVKHHGEFARVK